MPILCLAIGGALLLCGCGLLCAGSLEFPRDADEVAAIEMSQVVPTGTPSFVQGLGGATSGGKVGGNMGLEERVETARRRDVLTAAGGAGAESGPATAVATVGVAQVAPAPQEHALKID